MKNRLLFVFSVLILLIGICLSRSVAKAPPAAARAQSGPTQLLGLNGTDRMDVNASHEGLVHATATTWPLPTGAATSAKQDSLFALFPSALDSGSFKVAIENTPAVTVSGTVTTSTSAPSAIFTGQTKIAVSGTAVVLGSSQALTSGILITASPANGAALFVGGSSVNNTAAPNGNGYVLLQGQSVRLPGNNVNLFYINGTTPDYVTWVANDMGWLWIVALLPALFGRKSRRPLRLL